jgi:hypothetical protein
VKDHVQSQVKQIVIEPKSPRPSHQIEIPVQISHEITPEIRLKHECEQAINELTNESLGYFYVNLPGSNQWEKLFIRYQN